MKFSDYYWSRVKRLDQHDPECRCLIWQGHFTDNGTPIVNIGNQRMTAYALAWIVDGGMLSDGPFVRTCRTDGCVAVEHVRMKIEDPMMDELCVDRRLEEGFRMLDSGEDEDLSDADEEW